MNKGYLIMNGDGEYFSGFLYGGNVFWAEIEFAKPLYDDGHKFKMLSTFWFSYMEMIMEPL